MKNAALLAIIGASFASGASPAPKQLLYPLDYMDRAEASYQKRDYRAFLNNAEVALRLVPTDPSALYLAARAEALEGKGSAALSSLARAVTLGGVEVEQAAAEKDFESLRSDPRFTAILRRIDALRIPVRHSKQAFVIHEKALTPEGTAYDPVTQTLFLSSIYKRKIIAIAPDGSVRDFIPAKAYGIWAVGGLKVDPVRRLLWAASSAGPKSGFIQDATLADLNKTGLFKFDLNSGKLLGKYVMEDGYRGGGFNDLALAKNGDVYATDTGNSAVWKLPAATNRLEMFIAPDPIHRRFYNGIALTPDDKQLFVAHAFGIDLVNVATKRSVAIDHPFKITLGGVDGLSYYHRSLIAHQGSSIASINRYYLSPDLKRVMKREVIDSRLPEFQSPTTGAVAGDHYYYIANSQLHSMENGKRWPEERFKDVIILKTSLSRKPNQ